MKIIHHNLGKSEKGNVIEITLAGGPAHVQLMDNINYGYLVKGKGFNYIGGLVTSSPVRLSIPYSGEWHVIVDPRGLEGSVTSSVRFVTK